MASTKNSSEWIQPVVGGISIASGVISLAVFALQVVPGGLASALVALAGLAAAAAGGLVLRRGRIMKHDLRAPERALAWAVVGLALLTSVVVGARSMSGLFQVPEAQASSGSELDQPYPSQLVSGAGGGSYNMHKSTAQSDGGVSIRYYVVSDPYFLQTLFSRNSPRFDRQELLYPADDQISGELSDKRLIATLLDPAGSGVVSNEPLKYARFLYDKYIDVRRPVGKLTSGVASLEGKVGFDVRYKRDKISDELDVVWYEGDNADLLKGGWLNLDPLSREIVKANPKLADPIVKAGGVKYNTGIQCGGEGENLDFEYAFVVPRKIQLVLLDIENTSDLPIEKVSLGYSTAAIDQAGMYRLWDDAGLGAKLKSAAPAVYTVPGGLDPGEHTLLPIGVRVGQFDTSMDYDPTAGKDLGYMGPVAGLPTLDTGTGAAAVRPFDPANLAFVTVGIDEGSCPQIATWSDGASRWVVERKVIVGAHSPEAARTESWALDRFDGRVKLLERDLETSFVDEFVVQAIDELGRTVTLPPDDATLAARDGRSVTLKFGDTRTVTFAGWRTGLRDPRLVVSGWYLPDAEAAQ